MREQTENKQTLPEQNKLSAEQCADALRNVRDLHQWSREIVIKRAKQTANQLIHDHTASAPVAEEFLQADAKLSEVLAKNSHEISAIVEATFRLGLLAKGVLVAFVMDKVLLKLEAHARSCAGSIEGNQKRNDRYHALQSCYQRDVDRLMDEKGLSYTAACKKVGAACSVNERTVRQYTENKHPFNRGGRRPRPR